MPLLGRRSNDEIARIGFVDSILPDTRQGQSLTPVLITREVTIQEYAEHFLGWEKLKHHGDPRNLAPLEAVSDALAWMRDSIKLQAKLPRDGSDLRLCHLDRREVEDLRIPPHIVNDKWMAERGLWMTPPTAVIHELARAAVDRGFFRAESNRDTGQYKRYQEWIQRGTLERAITGEAASLLYRDEKGFLVVKDGWGRFLAFLALLLEDDRLQFPAVEAFVSF